MEGEGNEFKAECPQSQDWGDNLHSGSEKGEVQARQDPQGSAFSTSRRPIIKEEPPNLLRAEGRLHKTLDTPKKFVNSSSCAEHSDRAQNKIRLGSLKTFAEAFKNSETMFAMTTSVSTTLRVLSTFVLVAALVAAMFGLLEFFRGLSSIGSGKQDKEISTGGVFLPEVSVDRIRSTVARLSSVGSRVTGYPGAKASADFLEAEFLRLGMQDVHQEPFQVTVPVDKGASLRAFGVRGGDPAPMRLAERGSDADDAGGPGPPDLRGGRRVFGFRRT